MAAELPRQWLLTFSDMVMLLLAFFVLLFAMRIPDAGRWDETVKGINRTAEPVTIQSQQRPEALYAVKAISREPGMALGYLQRLLEQHLAADPSLQDVIITRQDDRLIVSLPSDLMFTPGSAEVARAGVTSLLALGNGLANLDNEVQIFGHADPAILRDGAFRNNWDLSLARALAVARLLYASGYGRSITVQGLGDGRFAELAPGLPAPERFALARRVDVIIRENKAR
jgi:chemotaxis protein MotB